MTWTTVSKVRENLIPYSNDFSQWTGPATVSGDEISDSSASVVQIKSVNASFLCDDYADKKPRCFSVYILKDSIPAATRICAIGLQYGSVFVFLKLDTKTGDIDDTTNASISLLDYGAEDDGSYWRLWLSTESDLELASIRIVPAYSNGLITVAVKAAATGSITCKNAQFENGTTPTDYYETTGTHFTWVTGDRASSDYSVQSASGSTWV